MSEEKKGILGRWWDQQRSNDKIGIGHASGMARSGAKEVSQVLPAFPANSVQPVEEAGVFGNLTNIEVVRGKEQEAPRGWTHAETSVEDTHPEEKKSVDTVANEPRQEEPKDPLQAVRQRMMQRQAGHDKGNEQELSR